MDAASLNEIISGLRTGELPPDAAADVLAELGETAKFAKIDHDRASRCGFPEFIYGEGKTTEQILAISAEIAASGQPLLATRVSAEAARSLLEKFPRGDYDELSRSFLMMPENAAPPKGEVVVATAGTTDLPVAREAERTLIACGCGVKLIPDAGVAGIHRLFKSLSTLESADVVIVVAGMEGALPSVVGGLIPCPVIAVPTSVGYGASLGGLTAMFSMLNSCANGITVVNIDNGFGAACAAARLVNSIRKN